MGAPPTRSAIGAATPARIAMGFSGNVLPASSRRSRRPTHRLQSLPGRIGDRLGHRAAPQPRWLRTARISNAAGSRSTVRGVGRTPAATIRCVDAPGGSGLSLLLSDVDRVRRAQMIFVSPRHSATHAALAVRRLRRTVTVFQRELPIWLIWFLWLVEPFRIKVIDSVGLQRP